MGVTSGGQRAVGRQTNGVQQTARAPSRVKDTWWGSPGSQNLRAKWRFRKGSIGLLGGASAEHGYSCGKRGVLFSGGGSLECLERPLRTRPLWSCSWVHSLRAVAVETLPVPRSPLVRSSSMWTKDSRAHRRHDVR